MIYVNSPDVNTVVVEFTNDDISEYNKMASRQDISLRFFVKNAIEHYHDIIITEEHRT